MKKDDPSKSTDCASLTFELTTPTTTKTIREQYSDLFSRLHLSTLYFWLLSIGQVEIFKDALIRSLPLARIFTKKEGQELIASIDKRDDLVNLNIFLKNKGESFSDEYVKELIGYII
jgi:hypothetical protein